LVDVVWAFTDEMNIEYEQNSLIRFTNILYFFEIVSRCLMMVYRLALILLYFFNIILDVVISEEHSLGDFAYLYISLPLVLDGQYSFVDYSYFVGTILILPIQTLIKLQFFCSHQLWKLVGKFIFHIVGIEHIIL